MATAVAADAVGHKPVRKAAHKASHHNGGGNAIVLGKHGKHHHGNGHWRHHHGNKNFGHTHNGKTFKGKVHTDNKKRGNKHDDDDGEHQSKGWKGHQKNH